MYCPYDFEKVKGEPFIKLAAEVFEDIKLCYELNKTLNFWDEE